MPLSFTADLHAELLLPDGRVPLALQRALAGEYGELLELPLPDGTVNRVVLPARVLSGLLVTSDKAILVCVGDVTQNQPVALSAGGVFAVLGSEVGAVHACALSYTPGDGSVATCAVLALMQEPFLAGCARFAAHPTLAQGLLHCWDLDETSGTRTDHVGGVNALPLAEGGAPTTSLVGKVGRAALFTGTNWLASPDLAGRVAALFRPPFTLAFWLWIDAYPTTTPWCLVATGNSLSAGQYYFYCIVRSDDHRIQMSLMQGFGGVVSAATPPSVGAWHLVVGWSVTDMPGNVGPVSTHLQIDNGVIATTGSGAFQFPFGSPLMIGAIGNPGTSARLQGKMDQIMYWNRALTSQAERDEIWNAGRG